MSARHWLFDLGNTRLKMAPLLPDGVGAVDAVAHGGSAESLVAATLPEGDVAWLASVAPHALGVALLDALTTRFKRISIARSAPRHGAMRIAYQDPARLGVDRFLALIGAQRRSVEGALVVGVGTALTIDLIDATGLHRGGRIAPSPALMRQALHQRAPALPATGGRLVAFASDTDDALASGCDGAALALVDDSLRHATTLLGVRPRLIVHGGGASMLAWPAEAEHAPALVLEGLARWAGSLA